LCPAVTFSHQDGHHSAVALLLKAALIQVSDYRLLGASGFFSQTFGSNIKVWFQLSNWFQTRFLCEFPIGSYVKLSSAVGAILVEGPDIFLEENHLCNY
jgi:hypothetical protein